MGQPESVCSYVSILSRFTFCLLESFDFFIQFMMKPMRITVILPFPVTKPVGGAKNMYEYANRLQAKGHQVVILHSIKRPYKKSKSPVWLKQFFYKLRGVARPKWFPLNKEIKSLIVPEISDRYVPDGDIIFSTWWQMAYAISKLSPQKGKAFNIIQDYEVWKGQNELVHQSYCLPVNHMVIAEYLEEIVIKHSGRKPIFIPSAVDISKFFVQRPIEARNPESVMMLYSLEVRKGTKDGIEALVKLHEQIPSLAVTLFGVYEKPELPGWMNYHQQPGNLPDLYNQHAIFFSPSLGEGWGLPPAEAMACGCALVCTAIGGHAYAIDNETALTVQPKAVNEMKEKLEQLVTDNQRRISLAKRGNEYLVNNFSFDIAIARLEKYFRQSLS
ncbi:MAG: glycosyltransferase family 4 protein [Chitinophagaceae bacterium]